MNGDELDRTMFHWPAVIRSAADDWTRRFALAIQKRARNPRWRPSPKQAEQMRRLVAELFEADPAPILIDDERRHGAA